MPFRPVALLFATLCYGYICLGPVSVGAAVARSTRIRDGVSGLEAELESELQDDSGTNFMNEWAAQVVGGREVADQLATDLGYVNQGQIGSLKDYYLFVKDDHPHRSKRAAHHHTRSLQEDSRVVWVEQQFEKIRVKRDMLDKRQEQRAYQNAHFDDYYWQRQWYLNKPHSRQKRTLISKSDTKKAYDSLSMNDPDFVEEWYLYDDRISGDTPKMDLHVVPCWAAGLTGRGVNVTVLDDGLEKDHPDLAANYNQDISYDFNDNDPDPTPRYDERNTNKHGTRCAGEIAMIANNGICGVGVAYNVNIGGIRMLDGIVTDRLEAQALVYALEYVDIYSCSWGPNDDGKTTEGPGKLATEAFQKGITEGRNGLGVIYIWASGNGGSYQDNCDCDGYTGSIYTISISSTSQKRNSPWYGEACASTLAATYSSGDMLEKKIVSTDLLGKCTTEHTGTSASAPLAAGILALLLEANPQLTWRDVQHLIVWTSEYSSLKKDVDWIENGAGFKVNNHFGFGLLNAEALVNAADPDNFKTVPAKTICTVDSTAQDSSGFPIAMSSGEKVVLSLQTTGCKGQNNEITYLEHVQVILEMQYSRRGDVEIFLESPSGTRTTLLTERPRDHSSSGFKNWAFMSVQNWGEDPNGTWKLEIEDNSGHGDSGEVKAVTLVLHGIATAPYHVQQAGGKRTYNLDYNSVHNRDDNTQ